MSLIPLCASSLLLTPDPAPCIVHHSPNGLVNRLRMMGQRVAAFGWAPVGPVRDLIESSGLDAWLEGPTFGSGINHEQLVQVGDDP